MPFPDTLALPAMLCEDGLFRVAQMRIEDGHIAGIALEGDPVEPAGVLALPGIVDLHGDAIERSLMPRPGVFVPVDVGLLDTDRQLLACGITTALHGLTCSWEPGLRSATMIDSILDTRDELGDALWADHKMHLRFESHAFGALPYLERWLAGRAVDMISINRHFDSSWKKRGDVAAMHSQAKRSGLSLEAYMALHEDTYARGPEADELLAIAFRMAGQSGVPRAAHDERTVAERDGNRALGATILDFPLARPPAIAARELGEAVIMGAPNVLRGGSHMGSDGIGAADMVLEGYCTILASDYFYPAVTAAVARLWRDYGMAFGKAWELVSTNPAKAVGLDDRGVLAVGKRADIVMLDVSGEGTPRVVEVIAGGRRVIGKA